MRGTKTASRTGTDLSGLYKLAAVLCMGFAVAPYLYILAPAAETGEETSPVLRVIFVVGGFFLLAFGYFLQALIGKLFGLKHDNQDFSYEGLHRYYQPVEASAVILLGIVLLFAARSVSSSWLYATGVLTTSQSLVPWVIGALCGLLPIFGSYLWFFPYNRLCTLPRCAVMLVFFLIALFLSGGAWFTTVCFSLAVILMMVLMNQTFLSRSYKGTVTAAINNTAKGYNLRLIGICLLVLLALLAVFAGMVLGLTNIFWFLLSLLLSRVGSEEVRDQLNEYDPQHNVSSSEMLSGKLGVGQAVTAGATYFVIFVGIIAVIGIILRQTGALNRLLGGLIEGIRAFFRRLFSLRLQKKEHTQTRHINYEDTVETVTEEKKQTAYRYAIFTYQDFLKRLKQQKTSDAQIRYAYGMLANRFCHMDETGIRKADTPFEINRKLKKRELVQDFDEVTAVFEQMQYADIPPTDAECDAVLTRMCQLAMQYIY